MSNRIIKLRKRDPRVVPVMTEIKILKERFKNHAPLASEVYERAYLDKCEVLIQHIIRLEKEIIVLRTRRE
jgi:hypothetical protein